MKKKESEKFLSKGDKLPEEIVAYNEEFSKRYDKAIKAFAKDHPNTFPPIIQMEDGRCRWMNRKERRLRQKEAARLEKKRRKNFGSTTKHSTYPFL